MKTERKDGENSNVSLLREAYGRWHDTRGGSIDHWMSLMTDDIKFNYAEGDGDAKHISSMRATKADIENYFRELTDNWEMEHQTVNEFVSERDRVVAIGHTAWTNKRTGKRMTTPKVDVFRFRDGLICEFREYYDTAALVVAASDDG